MEDDMTPTKILRPPLSDFGSVRTLALGVVIAPLLAPIVLLPEDWAGWLLLLAAFALVIFHRPFRKNYPLFLTAAFLGLVPIALALVNSYITTLPGGEIDAAAFLQRAEHVSLSGDWPSPMFGANAYVSFLALQFMIFGQSKLLAHASSAFGANLGLVVFERLYTRLSGGRTVSPITLIIFGLLPSALLHKAAVLREPWEALFFSSTVLLLLRLASTWRLATFFCFLISALACGIWHSALSLTALVLLLLAGGIGLRGTTSTARKVLVAILLPVIIAPAAWWAINRSLADRRVSAVSEEAFSSGGIAAIETLAREGAGRASYAHAPGMTGVARLPVGFLYYWLAPLPWQVGNFSDLVALLENLLRTALLIGSLTAYRLSKGQARTNIALALSALLIVELIWSAGTSNWGTALRHHIPSYGPLCAMGIFGCQLYFHHRPMKQSKRPNTLAGRNRTFHQRASASKDCTAPGSRDIS